MKIRNGFVSNSSSSSFVVRRGTDFGFSKSELKKSTEKKLEKFGFRKTTAHVPDQVPSFSHYANDEWQKTEEFLEKPEFKDAYNYGYEITCNQDDVIQFLIKNKIPFIASCHYGHESIIYTADDDTIYIAQNLGRILETYGVSKNTKSYETTSPLKIMSGEEWLQKNKW